MKIRSATFHLSSLNLIEVRFNGGNSTVEFSFDMVLISFIAVVALDNIFDSDVALITTARIVAKMKTNEKSFIICLIRF